MIRALCTLAVFILFAVTAQAQTPPPIVIGTGPVAGFAFALGGEICRLYEQESAADKARCSVVASDGSVEDLKRLRAGEVDLALVQSDHAGDALTANGAFVGMPPFAEIRGILGFYTDALTVLVRADGPLKTVDDLKGKRIAVGKSGDPDTLFGDFLEALGWLKTDMGGFAEMARGDQISALCRGRIAAIAVTAPHPNGFVREALAACPTRLLDLGGQGVDAAVAAHHAYGPVTIDAGTYGGPKEPIQSFGPRTVLVTTAKLPDEIVGRLAAAIFDHLEALKKAHPAFGGLDRASLAATAGLGVARHPAAAKYLSDNKLGEPASE